MTTSTINVTSPRGKSIFVIVMGVSGSGKTTIGRTLAENLNLTFLDADSLHPNTSLLKMKAGTPLNDEDRLQWLQIISDRMDTSQTNGQGLVIGCSALKVKYRRILRGFCTDYTPNSKPPASSQRQVHFLYLRGSYEALSGRIQDRKNHFMPASLLQSQFDALEEPTDAEGIDDSGEVQGKLVIVNIDSSPSEIVSRFTESLNT